MCRNSLPIYTKEKCFLFALGRNAIYAACSIFGLKADDEILTPAFDCDGSLQPFKVLGLKLIFFRSDPGTFAVDIEDIKRRITSKTKLIHIINHFGFPQPWDELLALRKETGIPVLEDNAYSLFSSFRGSLFGSFGDVSIFSLRKNLPLTDGGMLRLNNSEYKFKSSPKKAKYCYPAEYPEVLRLVVRKIRLRGFLRQWIKRIPPMSEPPPPLYSEAKSGFPPWPARDLIGREFSCDYFRPMSRLARKQLGNFSQADFIEISEKKRYYYAWLSERLREMRGIKVLWPDLPPGIVPFCLCCMLDSGRDAVFKSLRRKYEVMAWPTLPGMVLERLYDYPEVELLGRKLLQINLPSYKVRAAYFSSHMQGLVADIARLLNGIPLDNRDR